MVSYFCNYYDIQITPAPKKVIKEINYTDRTDDIDECTTNLIDPRVSLNQYNKMSDSHYNKHKATTNIYLLPPKQGRNDH